MRHTRLPGLLLGAALAVVAAACSGGTTSSGPAGGGSAAPVSPAPASASASAASPVPATSEALDGRTFVSTGMTGASLVEGSTVTIRFEGNRIGLSAGCNQGSGAYRLDDGVLSLGLMATTEMACERPLMTQDTAITAFLDGATATLAGDTLTAAKGDVTLTLLDESVASPDAGLEGPRWVVTDVQVGSTVSTVPTGATAALTFDGGKVAVEAGCNTGSGPYTLDGDTITFGPIALTMMACPPDKMALETAVLSVLTGDATYSIEGGTLRLVNEPNGLHLVAQP
jgi:heat shock protein HslJ